jgi:hypothetical protein
MNKKQFILFAVILFTLPFSNFALALEANYPAIPGLPIIVANSTIPELIQYFFGIGILFSGAIALISLAFAGIQLIIKANPEGVSSAKDRIKGSILGIVLIMVSFLIMKSINPVLVEPTITPLTSGPGIFLVKGDKETVATMASNVSGIPQEFQGGDIEYRCPNPTTDPDLLIWLYDNKNLDSSGFVDTIEVKCQNSHSLLSIPPDGSYKMAYETPGIYIYKNTSCTGYRSDVITTSGEIPEEFKKRPATDPSASPESRCVEFINDLANKIYYGAILHSVIDESKGGTCQAPLIYTPLKPKGIVQVSIDTFSSITVVNINDNPKTSGDGIMFYSSSYGWDTGAKTGVAGVIFKEDKYFVGARPENIKFQDFQESMTPEEIAVSQNFSMPRGQGSMRLNGNFLVAIYSTGPAPSTTSPATNIPQNGYCQVFKNNVVEFKGTEFKSKDGGHKIEYVYMIATK